MVSEGQVHVLNEGDSVVLECSFHADGYSLFDYPVLWRKTQRGEDTQMNIMGNINEPFASTNRFEVAFTALAPRYKFELSILGQCPHDNNIRLKTSKLNRDLTISQKWPTVCQTFEIIVNCYTA